jgi:hypothetical protein
VIDMRFDGVADDLAKLVRRDRVQLDRTGLPAEFCCAAITGLVRAQRKIPALDLLVEHRDALEVDFNLFTHSKLLRIAAQLLLAVARGVFAARITVTEMINEDPLQALSISSAISLRGAESV